MDDNSGKNDKIHEVEVYYKLSKDIPIDIVIEDPKTISQEELNKM